jgi:hypothetical protein
MLFSICSVHESAAATFHVKAVSSDRDMSGVPIPPLDSVVFFLWPKWEFLPGTAQAKTATGTNHGGAWLAFIVESLGQYKGYDSLTNPGQYLSATYGNILSPSAAYYFGRLMFTSNSPPPSNSSLANITGDFTKANSFLLEFYSFGINIPQAAFIAYSQTTTGIGMSASVTLSPKY